MAPPLTSPVRAVTHTGAAQPREAGACGPAEVLEDLLYLGSAEHALSASVLQSLGITHVLTVTARGEVNSLTDNRVRLHLQVRDAMVENIAVLFPKAVEFIDAAQAASGRCLVHCLEGRSRSASLCLAYLMVRQNVSLLEAWQHVQACRPEAFPNPGFWRQLQEYEEKVHGQRSELPDSVLRWLSKFELEAASPQSLFSEYLSASLNGCLEGKSCAIAAWSEDWKDAAAAEVISASFEKLPTEARRVSVEMLHDLVRSNRLPLADAARGIASCVEDPELVAELRIDYPHFDEYRDAVVAAAHAAGLLFLASTPRRQSQSLEGMKPERPNRTVSAPEPELDRDYFAFPGGEAWSLPQSWGCGDRARAWKRQPAFKLTAYVCVRQDGDAWKDEVGKDQAYTISRDNQVVDVPIGRLQRPKRQRPRGQRSGGVFLERQRLERVLDAMVAGKPLPPVLVDAESGGGGLKVANGFHRYFASLILGFRELPVECPKGWASPKSKDKARAAPKPKWVPPSVRRRMEEEARLKQAARQAARSTRRHEGMLLVKSPIYEEQEAKMHAARAGAKKNWGWVPRRDLPAEPAPLSLVEGERQPRPAGLPPPPPALDAMRTFSSTTASSSSRSSPVICQSTKEQEPPSDEAEVLPPSRFGMTADGDTVRGSFPLAVVRELHSLRQKRPLERDFLSKAIEEMDAGRGLPLRSYQRCVSLLGLSTLESYGLSADAPERYGLRRMGWERSNVRFQGPLKPHVIEEVRRLTWVGKLEAEQEDFLKKVLHRAVKNGAEFFLTPRDFVRFVGLRRSTSSLAFADALPANAEAGADN